MGLLAYQRSEIAFSPVVMSPETAASQWKAVEAVRSRSERRWAGRASALLRQDFDVYIRPHLLNVETIGEAQVRIEQALPKAAADWYALLEELYLDLGERTAPAVRRALMKSFREGKDEGDGWTRLILRWIQANGLIKARQVVGTSLKLARDILALGVREGWSIAQVASRLSDRLALDYGRATVWARTEIIPASNLGARAGALDTGLDLDHIWIATPGSSTRAWHAQASGQRRHINAAFQVMGQNLMFPGDTSLGASAKNVVQCRCTVGFQRVGS